MSGERLGIQTIADCAVQTHRARTIIPSVFNKDNHNLCDVCQSVWNSEKVGSWWNAIALVERTYVRFFTFQQLLPVCLVFAFLCRVDDLFVVRCSQYRAADMER